MSGQGQGRGRGTGQTYQAQQQLTLPAGYRMTEFWGFHRRDAQRGAAQAHVDRVVTVQRRDGGLAGDRRDHRGRRRTAGAAGRRRRPGRTP